MLSIANIIADRFDRLLKGNDKDKIKEYITEHSLL